MKLKGILFLSSLKEVAGMDGMSKAEREERFVNACAKNDIEFVKKFIESGGDINGSRDPSRATGFFNACHFGNEGIVELLLQNKADVNQKRYYTHGTLYAAFGLLNAVTVSFTGQSPYRGSCQGVLKCLLKHDIQISDEDVVSSIFYASSDPVVPGMTDMLQSLFDYKCDPDAQRVFENQNSKGFVQKTQLSMVIQCAEAAPTILSILLRAGVTVNKPVKPFIDKCHLTPLQYSRMVHKRCTCADKTTCVHKQNVDLLAKISAWHSWLMRDLDQFIGFQNQADFFDVANFYNMDYLRDFCATHPAAMFSRNLMRENSLMLASRMNNPLIVKIVLCVVAKNLLLSMNRLWLLTKKIHTMPALTRGMIIANLMDHYHKDCDGLRDLCCMSNWYGNNLAHILLHDGKSEVCAFFRTDLVRALLFKFLKDFYTAQ